MVYKLKETDFLNVNIDDKISISTFFKQLYLQIPFWKLKINNKNMSSAKNLLKSNNKTTSRLSL